MTEPSDRPDLNDPETYEFCVRRIHALDREATPEWGEMSVGQMLAHCTELQKVMNGGPLEGTPWYIRLAGPLVKRLVLADRPFRVNMPTHPQYEITSEKEFETEQRRLLEALETFRARGRSGIDHAIFGRMTPEQTGWAAYKHLDHHLRQFDA